jgi:hypothetical protein
MTNWPDRMNRRFNLHTFAIDYAAPNAEHVIFSAETASAPRQNAFKSATIYSNAETPQLAKLGFCIAGVDLVQGAVGTLATHEPLDPDNTDDPETDVRFNVQNNDIDITETENRYFRYYYWDQMGPLVMEFDPGDEVNDSDLSNWQGVGLVDLNGSLYPNSIGGWVIMGDSRRN